MPQRVSGPTWDRKPIRRASISFSHRRVGSSIGFCALYRRTAEDKDQRNQQSDAYLSARFLLPCTRVHGHLPGQFRTRCQHGVLPSVPCHAGLPVVSRHYLHLILAGRGISRRCSRAMSYAGNLGKRADYLATRNQMMMASTIETKMMIAVASCSRMNCNVRIAILLKEGGTGRSERQFLSLLLHNQVECRARRGGLFLPKTPSPSS
jgi:hypothetical protein